MMKPKAIIVDLDGTITDDAHRLPIIHKDTVTDDDWQEFFDLAGEDGIREHVVMIMRAIWYQWLTAPDDERHRYPMLFILTGRPDSHKGMTELFLGQRGVPYHNMMMREAGDRRLDTEIKKEFLDALRSQYEIICAIDDRPSVIEMWKAEGIPVLELRHQDWSKDEGRVGCYANR